MITFIRNQTEIVRFKLSLKVKLVLEHVARQFQQIDVFEHIIVFSYMSELITLTDCCKCPAEFRRNFFTELRRNFLRHSENCQNFYGQNSDIIYTEFYISICEFMLQKIKIMFHGIPSDFSRNSIGNFSLKFTDF